MPNTCLDRTYIAAREREEQQMFVGAIQSDSCRPVTETRFYFLYWVQSRRTGVLTVLFFFPSIIIIIILPQGARTRIPR